MKLSTFDVRDVIVEIMIDSNFTPEDVAIFERHTQPLVGLMGSPINTDMNWEEITDLIKMLCAPDDGYGADPSVTNSGLMKYGYSYREMADIIRLAVEELRTLYDQKD